MSQAGDFVAEILSAELPFASIPILPDLINTHSPGIRPIPVLKGRVPPHWLGLIFQFSTRYFQIIQRGKALTYQAAAEEMAISQEEEEVQIMAPEVREDVKVIPVHLLKMEDWVGNRYFLQQ